MIVVQDQILVGSKDWYFAQVEIYPCRAHWNRGHRWFAEVSARKTDWPKEDKEPYMWNHYYKQDYGTWSLRGAWFKAHKAIEELEDMFEKDPDLLPE